MASRVHGLTDAALDDMRPPYEQGEYKSEVGTVYNGFYVGAVGKRRATVMYDAFVTQRVADIARKRGVKPSGAYRDALDYCLAAQA